MRIIDIGCAHGIHVPLFLGMGHALRYEGMDRSRGLLSVAKRRYPHVRFFRGDLLAGATLPVQRYDGFWAPAVFMHIPEAQWTALLANIERMVRPRGVGYLTLPRQRPNPPSRIDTRYFSYWTVGKARTFLQPRHWTVLQWGHIPHTKRSWFWMLVRLP